MVIEAVETYCRRLGRLLGRQVNGMTNRDIRAVLDELGKARESSIAALRLRGLPVRVAQALIAPLFPTDPDWRFLRSHSPEELIDIAFRESREVLEWLTTDAAREESAVREADLPFFDQATMRGVHQQPCTPASAIRRVRLVRNHWHGERSPRILLLGDDDLVSLTFAREVGWPTTVVEIDQRVIDTIAAAHSPETPINLIRGDLRNSLPQSLAGRFDIVLADPMYTSEGLEIFLRNALLALGNTPDALLFLSFNDSLTGPTVLQDAIANLEKHNMTLIERFPRFNVYPIPPERSSQLRKASTLFFSNPIMHAMLDVPIAFSDMLVFRRIREKDADHGA